MSTAEPVDTVDLVDFTNDTRGLVIVAMMAVCDFPPDSRTAALRSVLGMVEDRLQELAGRILPGEGDA